VTVVHTPDLEKTFNLVPLLAGYCREDFQIKLLPGFTNQNFHLKNNQHDWVLRIPKQKTNRYIDRKQERHNASLANRLGIAPECIWRDDTGLSLTRTLLKSDTINETNLASQKILNKLAGTLGRLHRSKTRFHGVVNLAELLRRYYQLIPERLQSQIEAGYNLALEKFETLSAKDNLLVPSHNDLVLENILIDEAEKIWFIDWEYASMASPYWDLATLCNAADFDPAECVKLLEEYKKYNLKLDYQTLIEYRYMLKVLSICWMVAFTAINIESEIIKLTNLVYP
jgi:thiamine kinase-like enzyme